MIHSTTADYYNVKSCSVSIPNEKKKQHEQRRFINARNLRDKTWKEKFSAGARNLF